nr:immunoglobulin light chain junction region [Macaca mulatta]MOX58143.1 immunoglobulin light chain junction region [Macaca mulatta]MOX58426.1 immunoglobulin light chain junction region [Macaca mulatta]
CHHTYGIPFTF